MAHNMSRAKRAAIVRSTRLANFRGWHMVVECSRCRQTRQVSLDALLGSRPPGMELQTVATAIGRLRCCRCGEAPANVALTNNRDVTQPVWGHGAY